MPSLINIILYDSQEMGIYKKIWKIGPGFVGIPGHMVMIFSYMPIAKKLCKPNQPKTGYTWAQM